MTCWSDAKCTFWQRPQQLHRQATLSHLEDFCRFPLRLGPAAGSNRRVDDLFHRGRPQEGRRERVCPQELHFSLTIRSRLCRKGCQKSQGGGEGSPCSFSQEQVIPDS